MDAPIKLAQTTAGGGASPARVVRIEKPATGQAITIDADRLGNVQLDLSAIADETITLVRVGDTLVILFDNRSTITLDPFYLDGVPLADLSVQLGPDRVVTALDFAKLFPITEDQSVLPAAGGPKSGAFFTSFTIEDLAGADTRLALLSDQGIGSTGGGGAETGPVNTVPRIGTPDHRTADDGALSDGNGDRGSSPGDAPDAPDSVTGSLAVDFGLDLVGRSLAFSTNQPGLTGLKSGGLPITTTLSTINGLPALIGHTGDPSDPVFVVTLDITPLNGAYHFELKRPLDHPIAGEEDDVTVSVAFIATDGNGDSANGVFNVTIDDDSPALFGPVTTGLTLDEDDLANGTDGTGPLQIVGELDLRLGADGGAIALSAANATWNAQSRTLLDNNGIWQIALTNDGHYVFSLLKNSLGHGPGDNGENLLPDILVNYAAVDGDGDTLTGSFTVNIVDDIPHAEAVAATMSENQDLTVDFIEGAEFSFGADLAGAGGLTFGNLTVENVPNGLTFDAQQIANLLQFTPGQIALAPGDAFDSLGAGESVTLRLPYSLTDGDGDSAANEIVITVEGENDAPEVTAAALSGAITEDRSSAPNAIVDGSFEGGIPGPWTGDFFSFGSGLAHTGALAALVFVPGSLRQTLQTVAGQNYTLDFWVNEFGFTGSLTVRWNGTPVGDFTFGGGSAYQPYSIDLTGLGTAADLEFQFGGGSWSLLVDDVSMQGNLDPLEQSTTGSISFTDVDLNDTHSASFAAQNGGAGYLGAFTLAPIAGTSGAWSLDWSFTVDRADLQFLAEGQSVQQFYDVTISDGNGGTITETVTISLTGTNDAPALDGFGNSRHFAEQGPAVVINAALEISDIDSTTLSGATVSITGNFQQGADVLGFTNQNGITGIYNAATGVLTLSGTATVEEYETALRSVTFENTSNGPVIDPRTISFQVNDGASEDNLSNVASSTVTIGPANDAPVITSPPATVQVTEDWSYTVPLGELVTNGGFEPYGFIDGWANNGFVPIGDAHSGAGAVGTGSPSGQTTGVLAQTIDTVAGVTYRIEFWASNPFSQPAGFPQSLTVAWGGLIELATSNIPIASNYDDYSRYTIDVLATGSSADLIITMSDSWGWWVLDDVSVTAVDITPGIETDAGTIAFTDPDSGDTHTVTITPGDTNYFGDFTWTLTDSPGTGFGEIDWQFTVDDADIGFLGAGETRTQVYTVEVNDGNGGIANQDVTVVLNGVNDAPELAIVPGPANGIVTKAQSQVIDSQASALNIDNNFVVSANPDIQDSATTPWVSIQATGNGRPDYYAFTVTEAGSQAMFDIDHTTGGFDSKIYIYDSSGTLVAEGDDSLIDDGGNGSSSTLDSFLVHTFAAAGTYYIAVGSYSMPNVPAGAQYQLQISLENASISSPVFFSAEQDSGAPAGAVGMLVSGLIDTIDGSGRDNVADQDANALTGIALIDTNEANGTWWYSLDDGATWQLVGAVSDANALLLSAEGNARIYFEPDPGFSGEVAGAVAFRAWDQTSGSEGDKADTTANGGSTAFSAEVQYAAIEVVPDPQAVDDVITINGYSGVPGTADATPVVDEAAGDNETRNNAQVINRDAFKIAPNANLGDASLPSVTIRGSITGGSDEDFYRVELKAGEAIILDMDNTSGSLDTVVRLYGATGSALASNDDKNSPRPDGGGSGGGNGSLDSFLEYSATQDGFYYIEIDRFSGTGSYDLQVSIEDWQGLQGDPVTFSTDLLLANDHDLDGDALTVVGVSGNGVTLNGDHTITVQPGATSFSYTISDGAAQSSATVTVQQTSGQTNTGTADGDLLVGSNVGDLIDGLAGDDFLFGGGGEDILAGGRGSDMLEGGADSDTFRWFADDLDGGGLDEILDFAGGAGGDIIDLADLLAGIAGNKADHVRFADVNGDTRLASAGAGSTLADGDLTLQVNLSGGDWTDVAVIHDAGPNLDTGDNVLRMLLDSSAQQVIV